MATRGDTAPLQEKPDSDVIGIHLGGSSFCVSVWDAAQGWVRVLRAPSSSVVTYLGEREVVGDRERQVRSPKKSVTNCRWMLGRPYTELQTQLDRWSCALLQDKQDRALLDVRSDGDRVSAKSCEQACAAILTEAKSATQKAGSECSIAVITAPPGFTEEQHRALEKSLSLAELSAVHIIPEQEAAALSYTLHPETAVVDRAETWLLFRVGGSSSFASVVRVSPAAYPEVLATRHDHTLGGALLTRRLISLLPAQWRETVPSTRLHALAEQAKIKLSTQETCTVFHPDDDEEVGISREQLQEASADLWWKWQQLIIKVMSEVTATAEEIDRVILVGAASRTPHFKDMVGFAFPGKLFSTIISPEEVLSHGAAIQSAILSDNLEIERQEPVIKTMDETWNQKERRVLNSYMTTVLVNKKKQQQGQLLVLCERAKENFCTTMELRVSEFQTAEEIGTVVKEVLKYVLETFKKLATNCSRDVRKPYLDAIRQYAQMEIQRYLSRVNDKETSGKDEKVIEEKTESGEVEADTTSSPPAGVSSAGLGRTLQVAGSQTGAIITPGRNFMIKSLTGAVLHRAGESSQYPDLPPEIPSSQTGAVITPVRPSKPKPPTGAALHRAGVNSGWPGLTSESPGSQTTAVIASGRNFKSEPLSLEAKMKAKTILLKSIFDKNAESALHWAAREGHTDVVRLLLEQGVDREARDKMDRTPLHVAAKEGHSPVVKVLAEKGCNLDVKSNIGVTPLHLAAHQGKVETVRLLAQLGADVNIRSSAGETPLHAASDKGKVGTVRLLVELGADVNARTNRGHTPLQGAAAFANAETVQLLLDLGANVNNKDTNGDTPLHETAFHNKLDSARVLVERGADINARNLKGNTPLSDARGKGNTKLATFLQSCGASL